MQIKITILNNLRVILLLPMVIFYAELLQAQIKGTVPVTLPDSIAAIKKLVKENIIMQLQEHGTYKKIEQNHLKQLLKNPAAADSLGKLILQQMQQLKSNAINTGKSVETDVLHTPEQILRQHISKLTQAQNIKGLISQFAGIIKKPVLQWKGGSVNITGQTTPSLFNAGNILMNSTAFSGNLAVKGIPVGVQFMRQDFNGPEYYSRSTFSFQFDREAYLNSLRDKIKLKMKASDLLPDYNDALQKLKEAAMGRLKSSLDSINTAYKGSLDKQLETLGGAEGILMADASVLQEKLFSADFLQNAEQKKNLLAQMQQQLNTGDKVDMNLYNSLLQSVQAVSGTNKIINAIRSFKEDVQKSGLMEKLREAVQFKNNNMQQWLQDPGKLKSLAKEQLDLNGIQKLFLNMYQLKIGMNTVNLSPLTVYQYVNNGFNASFVNKKTYLFIMAGRQQDLTTLLDNRYSAPLFSIANTAIGIRIGKGDITENHTHISLFTYKQNKSGYNENVINTMPGNTMVATFSNQLRLNKTNYLDFEISKSAHKYSNQLNIYDTLQQGNNISKQLLVGENFIQQMAFTLQWKGQLKENELDYDLHATRMGKSYSNPGSMFISGGTTEFGGSLRKSFLQNQLQLYVKGNYREYEYSSNNTKWQSYNFSFQGKWKLKKGQYISLRYQPYQSLRIKDDKKYNTAGSNRLTIDGNFRRRFGKINYQQTISLSALQNNYQFDSIPVNNKSVLISSVQTITVDRKSYFVNMQYNIANTPSAVVLFNTQFNADAGYMYAICKGIMGSTAINYNSTKGWFQQLGIKQTLSGQLGERFIVSVYTDIAKNIKEYRSNNMGNTRLDWSLQYVLK